MNSDKDVIINYFFEKNSDDNMYIALTLGYNITDLKIKIIKDFWNSLEQHLRLSPMLKNISDWQIQNDFQSDFWGKRYNGFRILKTGWADGYAIEINADLGNVNDLCVGVKKPTTAHPLDNQVLRNKLDEKMGIGGPIAEDGVWEWWKALDNKWRYCDNADTMMRLYQKIEGVEYMAEKMLAILNVSEDYLDKTGITKP
ncbi:MAG: hypothetical protein H6Q66_2004 [Firmicutes bacterium]|nr:hypothetical protein [Bacillota bacterium]